MQKATIFGKIFYCALCWDLKFNFFFFFLTVLLAVIAVASATQNGKAPQSASKVPEPKGKSPLVLKRDPTGVAPQSLTEKISSLKLQDSKTIKIAPSKSLKIKSNKPAAQADLPQGVVKGKVSRLIRRIDSKNSNMKLDRAQQELQGNLDTIADIRERTGQRDWDNFGKK